MVDLRELRPPKIDGPAIALPSLRFGSSNILHDWIVDNRVVATTASVDATLAREHQVAFDLAELSEQLDKQIDALEQESWEILLQHPGTL